MTDVPQKIADINVDPKKQNLVQSPSNMRYSHRHTPDKHRTKYEINQILGKRNIATHAVLRTARVESVSNEVPMRVFRMGFQLKVKRENKSKAKR